MFIIPYPARKSSFSYLFTLVCFSFFFIACPNGDKSDVEPTDPTGIKDKVVHVAPYSDSFPLIVWRKPGTSKADFDKWISDKNPTIINFCKNCDSNLVALGGPGPKNFIMGVTVSSPSPGTGGKPSGEDDTVYYSANFNIQIPFDAAKETIKTSNYKPAETAFTDTAITVAVFDTGLDPDLYRNNKRWFASITNTCMPGGNAGWNFNGGNSNTFDDYPHKHGSLVSAYIIQEAIQSGKNDVRILPVKIHGKDGSSSLFDVLCGIAYAQKAGVKIINASFGYYTYGNNESIVLFKNFVDTYLTQNNILLICAAGNIDAAAEQAILLPGDPRDLGINPFYPASFSKDLINVVSVTTVSTILKTVSPNQNYSDQSVDVGVCRQGDNNNPSTRYAFANPLASIPDSLVGSSFAAPIVTGIVASNYNTIFPGGVSVAAITSALKGATFPHTSNVSLLESKIRRGKISPQ